MAVLYDLASTLFDWNAWQGYLDLTAALQEQHIPYDVQGWPHREDAPLEARGRRHHLHGAGGGRLRGGGVRHPPRPGPVNGPRVGDGNAGGGRNGGPVRGKIVASVVAVPAAAGRSGGDGERAEGWWLGCT